MRKLKAAVVGIVLLLTSCVASSQLGARSFVHALTGERGTFCSAVVLAPGLALTADHCAAAVDAPMLDGGQVAGRAASRGDDRKDLALLTFPRGTAACPCVRLAESEAEVDEPVYVIGYPRGIAQVVTVGTSQGVHDNAELPFGRRLVVTAPVTGGNSGGGVFVFRNGEYQLVGILAEGFGHLGFAVPLADIRPFVERFLAL